MEYAPRMSAEEADKAMATFFESAMTPEKEVKEPEDENAGVVEGLKCTLMKHQIEGLEFLLDHECLDDNVKGKGKYGGLLGDDVLPLLTPQAFFYLYPRTPSMSSLLFYVSNVFDNRWVSAKQSKPWH
jgi:SNF2 family DNA or RNA helicase